MNLGSISWWAVARVTKRENNYYIAIKTGRNETILGMIKV